MSYFYYFFMSELSIKSAVEQIADEKGLTVENIVSTIEAALAAAYRKDFGEKNQNLKAKFYLETGQTEMFDVKTVVEDELVAVAKAREEALAAGEEVNEPEPNEEGEEELRYNPKLHLGLTDAQAIKSDAKVGDEIVTELTIPGEFGRMAAQTAKQVIIQKIREAEHTNVYEAYKDKVGEVTMATVQRRDGRNVLMELGRGVGLLPYEEQIPREQYNIGERMKVYIMSVEQGSRGPQIILSRTNAEVVKQIFVAEIPEIANGLIEIKGISREPGARSKVAVEATDDNVDPIGSCVGQRGTRVQTIISELGGEKIDIIEYSEDPVRFISNALSPAKVLTLDLNEDNHTAIATVAEDQLSLAIGKGGQNVRLAAKLTGWNIDVQSETGEIQTADEGNLEVIDETGDGVNVAIVDDEVEEEPVMSDPSEEETNEETK
jgi:N utilization substance protein A